VITKSGLRTPWGLLSELARCSYTSELLRFFCCVMA